MSVLQYFTNTQTEGTIHSKESSTKDTFINSIPDNQTLPAVDNSKVVNFLGVHGYVTLVQALQHIPASFLCHCYEYIANILSIATKTSIEVSDLKRYIDMLEFDTAIPGTPLTELLWEVTFQYGFPYTLYLGPPITTCLYCEAPLHTHHAPSVVTTSKTFSPLL